MLWVRAGILLFRGVASLWIWAIRHAAIYRDLPAASHHDEKYPQETAYAITLIILPIQRRINYHSALENSFTFVSICILIWFGFHPNEKKSITSFQKVDYVIAKSLKLTPCLSKPASMQSLRSFARSHRSVELKLLHVRKASLQIRAFSPSV